MAVVTFGTVGTVLTGSNSTAASFAVPASVAANDVIVLPMYVEVAQTVTPSAGFAEAPNSPVTIAGTQPHTLHVFWKRATGADSGTYAFTVAAGLAWRTGAAMRITGCATSGSPFDVTTSANNSAITITATPGVSVTTTGVDRLLVWAASSSSGSACGAATGMTERFDAGGLASDTLAQPAAGASASITGTFATAASVGVWLGALKPDSVAAARALTTNEQLTVAVRRAGFY